MLILVYGASAATPSAAGDITVTEFQADTDRVPQYYGEWFELYNNYRGTLEFGGVTITRSNGDSITIDAVNVASGDYLVVGVSQNTTYGDANFNGNVAVDVLYAFADFNISSTADSLTVEFGGTLLDQVIWDSSWSVALDYAHSASLNAYNLEWANDYGVNWCSSTTYIAVSGMYGSPGVDNDFCGGSASVDDDGDGYSEIDGDCRDDDDNIHPGSLDGTDGIPQTSGGGGSADDDADCDGVRDNGVIDDDGDGYSDVDGDCDDADADAHPGAAEVADGADNDCDDCVDELDVDGDGYADSSSGVCGTDCDDGDSSVHPGATEIEGDGVDQNCDGADAVAEVDDDGDGYGYSDCNDDDPTINPGATEICDDVDNDCDLLRDEDVEVTWFEDVDEDGFGDPSAEHVGCTPPEGSVDNGADCDDADADRFPGNVEVCDARDNDCDDATYDPLECGDDEAEEEGEEECGCVTTGGVPWFGVVSAFVALAFVRARQPW